MGGVSRQREAGNGGKGRHDIDLANERGADPPAGNDPGPAHDERNAMATFPEVALQAAEWAGAPVLEILDTRIGVAFGAVIGGENDDRVVGETVRGQRREDAAHGRVGLFHEVAVTAGLGFPREFGRRYDGCVR